MKNIFLIITLFTMSFTAFAEKLTIVSVNNGDMVRMQKLSSDFTKKNPIEKNCQMIY